MSPYIRLLELLISILLVSKLVTLTSWEGICMMVFGDVDPSSPFLPKEIWGNPMIKLINQHFLFTNKISALTINQSRKRTSSSPLKLLTNKGVGKANRTLVPYFNCQQLYKMHLHELHQARGKKSLSADVTPQTNPFEKPSNSNMKPNMKISTRSILKKFRKWLVYHYHILMAINCGEQHHTDIFIVKYLML